MPLGHDALARQVLFPVRAFLFQQPIRRLGQILAVPARSLCARFAHNFIFNQFPKDAEDICGAPGLPIISLRFLHVAQKLCRFFTFSGEPSNFCFLLSQFLLFPCEGDYVGLHRYTATHVAIEALTVEWGRYIGATTSAFVALLRPSAPPRPPAWPSWLPESFTPRPRAWRAQFLPLSDPRRAVRPP